MADYMPVYGKNVNASGRPAAKTYQEQQEIDAQNLWNDQRSSLEGDRARAAGIRDETRTGAKTALDRVQSGAATNVGKFTASNTAAYQPTQIGQWLTSLTGSLGRGPSTMGGGAIVGGGGAIAAPAPSRHELDTFDPSELTNFDPSAAGKEYASGAYGDFQNELGDELQTLENRSVGAGRLRTGLFDRDQGNVVTRLGSDFNNKIAQQAGVFSGQRLSALQGGTDLAYRRASDIDTNARLAADRAASSSQADAELRQRAAVSANDFALGSYRAESDRFGLGLNAAEEADRIGYGRAADLDKYGFNQATYLDDQQFARDRTGLDAAMAEEGRYADEYNRTQDRMGSYASSTRDWAAADREAQDLRDEIARLRAGQTAAPKYGGNTSIPGYKTASELSFEAIAKKPGPI